MAEVTTSIHIDAPPEAVWELCMDPERLHEWVTIHRGLGKHSDPPPKQGDEMQQTLSIRGARFKVTWELATCEDGRHAIWQGRGPARSKAETEYTLSAEDGGTRFDYRNEFRAPLGPLGAAASKALVGGVPEKEAQASLQRLKSLLES